MKDLITLAFGGGTDSTGILCGWVEKCLDLVEPIDLILFADTGAERPWTYEHIDRMNVWLKSMGMPEITVVKKVRRDQSIQTLEEHCHEHSCLPSLAYGWKSCSDKFKTQPQNKFMNNYQPAKDLWVSGGKPTKLIGYEFEEKARWMKARVEDDKYFYRFPLVEWEWTRADAVAAIKRHGIKLPGKSSCFFCPANKKHEIDELKRVYPNLYDRAIAIEDKARPNLKTVKGLGRRFSWRDYAGANDEDIATCMYCVD